MTFGLPDLTFQPHKHNQEWTQQYPSELALKDTAVQFKACQIPAVIPGRTVCLTGGGKGYCDGCARGRPLG